MDNEQLTSNLGELIKNQIEICEKLDKMDRNFKKFKKSISPIIAFEVKQNIFDMVSKDIDFIKQEPSNYDLNNIFGNPVHELDEILFKQGGVFAKGSDQKSPFVCASESIISPKQPDQTDLRKQANDLVDKFMPLVNGWHLLSPLPTDMYYSDSSALKWCFSMVEQRKAAVKCAIVHCELMMSELIIDPKFHQWNDLKSELQKMLSE